MSDKFIQSLESQRKDIEENLDKVFSEYIKKKFGYQCVLTGEKRNATIFHVLGRARFPNIKYDEDNVFLVARREHEMYHEADPMRFIRWYLDTFGEERLRALRERAYAKTHTYSVQELMSLTNQYINKTRALPKAKASNGR